MTRAPDAARSRYPPPVATTALSTVARRSSAGRATTSARTAPPVLVRQIRNGIVESEHRGHVVEVDAAGRTIRGIGDPNHLVTLRSTVKPFGLVALL